MIWTDTLPTMPEFPAMFVPEPGTVPVRSGFHVRRAGFGVWAAVYLRDPQADARYAAFRQWKADPMGEKDFLDTAAGALVALIRAWSPLLPSDWIVTAPPAGATQGSTYPAGILAREVAGRLDIDFLTCLKRSDAKRHHHPVESRKQTAYTVAVAPPAVALVVDDFVSSGTTLRLAREALAAAGAPSFGFAWGAD
jgi:hypothetical protein